jgi:23S rRNA (uracil1939-C5)-methyltransferase
VSETIIRLAARGDGVTDAGRFVAGTAPGDLVDADGIVTAGPHRVVPPCRHFGRCGGCQLQHVDDASYLEFVSQRIVDALSAQGLNAPIRTPIISPPHSRRRASLRATRRGKQVVLGYAEAKSHTLVDLAECPVLAPELVALLKPLRQLLTLILPDRKTANVRMALANQGVDLMITGVEAEGLEAAEALAAFGAANGLARLSIDEGFGASPRYAPQPVTIDLGIPVALPDGAFLQATREGEAALCAAVIEALNSTSSRADLFAGIGTFTFAIDAEYAAEGARDAMLALKSAANAKLLTIDIEHRDLFRRPLMAAELARFDGVVIDPPRAGAKEQIAELAQSTVKRIASVSCNPATFARDAALLIGGGYKLDWVQPVGQFLWSTHVELVAQFSRR